MFLGKLINFPYSYWQIYKSFEIHFDVRFKQKCCFWRWLQKSLSEYVLFFQFILSNLNYILSATCYFNGQPISVGQKATINNVVVTCQWSRVDGTNTIQTWTEINGKYLFSFYHILTEFSHMGIKRKLEIRVWKQIAWERVSLNPQKRHCFPILHEEHVVAYLTP